MNHLIWGTKMNDLQRERNYFNLGIFLRDLFPWEYYLGIFWGISGDFLRILFPIVLLSIVLPFVIPICNIRLLNMHSTLNIHQILLREETWTVATLPTLLGRPVKLSLSRSSQCIFPKIALLSENIYYYGGSHFYLLKNDVHQYKNSRITKIL